MARKPRSKKELIKAVEHEWALLMKVVGALSEEQMNAADSGGWSAKDNLAHLAEWMNILMGYHMDKRPAHKVIGVTAEVTRDWNIEIINPVLLERNRDRPGRKVMKHLDKTYRKLLARLKATPFKELMKPRYAEDPKKQPLLLWVLGDTTDHFREHRKTIQKAVKEKSKRDAEQKQEVDSWFSEFDELSRQGDVEGMANMAMFPVHVITDDSSGNGYAENWTRDKFVQTMTAAMKDTTATMEMKARRTPFFLTAGIVVVITDAIVTTDAQERSLHYADILVKKDGQWKFQTMAQGGWGDMLKTQMMGSETSNL